MRIEKATWSADGDNLRLAMPLTKVDKENRIVSGFASLDNADTQGDVILKEANAKAFSRFRGNIREMHQPIAVGRMLNFKEDSFYDPKSEKFYNGIWVDVHVSKGAQDTWEKVLDGTLQGFSIGGSIIDSETQFVKEDGAPRRFIKDYELVELSLVDSPANPLANVFSISKVGGTMTVTGMIADVATENVFYCKKNECEIVKTSSDDSLECPEGHQMVNIGWFEYDGGDRTDKIRSIVNKYLSPENTQVEPANNEGGVEVATEENKPESGSPVPAEVGAGEEGKAQTEIDSSNEEVAKVDEVAADEETAEAADVSEVDNAEADLEKMFDDLKTSIDEGLEKNAVAVKDALAAVDAKMAEVTESFEKKITELGEKSNELTEKVNALSENIDKMEKSIEVLDAATAIKKSADLGGSSEDETLRKSRETSKWGNHFLGVDSLND